MLSKKQNYTKLYSFIGLLMVVIIVAGVIVAGAK